MTVNTKSAPHRTLRFDSFEDILAELDRIQASLDAGTVSTTGNWSVGEICDHCARFIGYACDGFEADAPWFVRVIARAFLLKKATGDEPIPPGYRLPRQAESMLPAAGISDADGIGELRKQLKRVLAGKEMTHNSPLLGRLTHEQWLIIQRKHCALHLGFINLGKESSASNDP